MLGGVVAGADGAGAAEFHDRSAYGFFEGGLAGCLPISRIVLLRTRRHMHRHLLHEPLRLREYLILPVGAILMPSILRGSVLPGSWVDHIARNDAWERIPEGVPHTRLPSLGFTMFLGLGLGSRFL